MEEKNPEGVPIKPKTVFAINTDFGLNQNSKFSEEEREICINVIRNSRNNRHNYGQNCGFSNYSSNLDIANSKQFRPKKDKKRKQKLLQQSNPGFETQQDTLKRNAEKENQ